MPNRQKGFLVTTSPDGEVERETFTCGHCNRIVTIEHGQRPEDIGGLCKQCMTLICGKCVDDGRCTPIEKRIEAMEHRGRVLRSYGL